MATYLHILKQLREELRIFSCLLQTLHSDLNITKSVLHGIVGQSKCQDYEDKRKKEHHGVV
jgi:hypothetical protein